MTIEQCQKCANYGVFGACRVELTTSGDWTCNFIPEKSVTILLEKQRYRYFNLQVNSYNKNIGNDE